MGRSRVARRTAGGEGWCGAGLAAGVPGGRRHEHGGPCPRGSVCPEARSDRGGEAGRARGGGCASAPGRGIGGRRRGAGRGRGRGNRLGLLGAAAGPGRGAEWGWGCGRARGPRSGSAPYPPPRRPWSYEACGRSRRAWWPAFGASAAWCVAGSPGTSAASRGSWTSTACAWWAWGPRPWACRSSWTVATSREVPALPTLLPLEQHPLNCPTALKPPPQTLLAFTASSLPSPGPSHSRRGLDMLLCPLPSSASPAVASTRLPQPCCSFLCGGTLAQQ